MAPNNRNKIVALSRDGARMTRDQIAAYWNASVHRLPPPLRTTFGNFTTVNSTGRYNLNTAGGSETTILVCWTPSAASAFLMADGGPSPMYTVMNTQLVDSGCLAIRPLRMDFSLLNVTPTLSIGGEICVASVDQPLIANITYAATPSASVLLSANSITSFKSISATSVESVELSAKQMSTEQHFTCVPASYLAYNAYQDFITLTTANSDQLRSYDAYSLMGGAPTYAGAEAVMPSALYGTSTLVQGVPSSVPPFRQYLITLRATPSAQNYVLSVHRQDGCRFPANSLGSAFASSTPQLSSAGEDKLVAGIGAYSNNPTEPTKLSTLISYATSAVSAVRAVAPAGSMAATAVRIADTAAKVVKVANAMNNNRAGIANRRGNSRPAPARRPLLTKPSQADAARMALPGAPNRRLRRAELRR